MLLPPADNRAYGKQNAEKRLGREIVVLGPGRARKWLFFG
jgi:hypothetical protein